MKKMLLILAILALMFWAPFSVVAQSQIQFNPYQIESSNESFRVISNGNTNGDNLTDLYLGSTTSPLGNNYQIKNFLQSPDPLIGLYPGYSFNYPPTPEGIVSMKVGIINNDELDDLAIAYTNFVQVYHNNSGIQELSTTKNIGATICDIDIGDINSDGRNDIVVGTYSGIKLLYQNPNGTFALDDYQYNNYGWGISGLCSVEIVDIEGDGDNDIAWLSKDYLVNVRAASIIKQTNGLLSTAYHLLYTALPNYFPATLVIAELDSDPGLDVFIGFDSSDTAAAGEIAVWSSTHLWTDPYPSDTIYTNHGSQAMKAKDIDKDGLKELIQIYNVNEISILSRNSEGDFSETCFPLPPSTTAYNHESLEVGDYNNDTLDDLAVADLEYGLIVLYQDNITSVNHYSLPTLKIFPNPVSEYLELNSESDGQLAVIDFLGRTLAIKKINRGLNRVDCSFLTIGTYLIKFTDPSGIKQAKIIKR